MRGWQTLLLCLLVAVALGSNALGLIRVDNLAEEIVREGNERRDQTCALFERDHLADVQRLENTYTYLEGLGPLERRENINETIFRGLPELEREARVDSAPLFCDEPGVGLPEPDPRVPNRPASLIP